MSGPRSSFPKSNRSALTLESDGEVTDDVEGGLRGSAFVAPQLHDVNAHAIGQRLLGQSAFLAHVGKAFRESWSAGRNSFLHETRIAGESDVLTGNRDHMEYQT